MLENKFSTIPGHYREKTTLKIYLKDDPKLVELMNVRKQGLFNSLCEDNIKLFKNCVELLLKQEV